MQVKCGGVCCAACVSVRTHCCFVAGLLQVLWQQGEATRQRPHCPMTKGSVDSSVDDVAAAQQARARRRADGLDECERRAPVASSASRCGVGICPALPRTLKPTSL
eukprot:COSAG06_NODE_1323_length_9859_cov_3.820082_3_plen_106_part_00